MDICGVGWCADHSWLHLLNESSPNGALPCTVPGPPGAGNLPAAQSCDASWASVFPTVAWALLKYQGDTSIARYWPGLKRFMANEIRQATANRTLGLHNMFASFGDWIWQPGATSGALNTVRQALFRA